MLLFLRKVLFYVLVVVYLFITPYTILYALGYIFNPSPIALVKTGLLSIDTVPSDVTVFVQGKKFVHRTPTAVRDLLPGRYGVRLFRKGYEPWEKEIGIEQEKAMRLKPVVLLPRKFEDEVVSMPRYEGMVPAILDMKIFAWESEGLSSLRKIDLFFGKETPVGRAIAGERDVEILDVRTKKRSPVILLQIKEDGKKGFLLLDAGEKSRVRYLDPKTTQDAWLLDWDARKAGSIYLLKDGILSYAEAGKNGLNPVIATDVLGFGLRESRLVILKKDLTLFEANRHGTNLQPLIFERPFTLGRIFGADPGKFYRLYALERDFLLFLSDEGELLSNRPPFHLVAKGVLGIEKAAHSEEEKVLFWTRDKIGVLHFGEEREAFFTGGDSPNISWVKKPKQAGIYSGGHHIRQAGWIYDDSHILFADEDRLYLAETENEPFHVRPVAEIAKGSRFAYTEEDRSIYFIDPATRRLIKRKLPN